MNHRSWAMILGLLGVAAWSWHPAAQASGRDELLPTGATAVRVNVSSDDLWTAAASTGRVRLVDVPDGDGGRMNVLLDRFEVLGSDAKFVRGRVGGPDVPLAYDRSRVRLYRGHVEGRPGDRAYLAVRADGLRGYVELGGQFHSMTTEATGAAQGGLIVRADEGGGVMPPVPVCGLTADAGSMKPRGEPGDVAPRVGLRMLELAIDTDYEYFELFNDVAAAGDYAVELYGAVSDVYMRDVDTRVVLTYFRIWDTPEDLYNQSDPLSSFQSEWEQNQDAVQRDVAQLLTGRRDLPYGGVAYLEGLCSSSAYSVTGFINGSFASTSTTDPGNWDLIVTAHELGHNCGTLHTHDGYSPVIDACGLGVTSRGTIMSYCHITPGGISNIDMHMHSRVEAVMRNFMQNASCLIDDCNANGVADPVDLSSGTSVDANGSGIPDECEDCNGNGVLDSADIAGGMTDVDGNDVPDVCQSDCNGNAAPDTWDIGTNVSEDADGNNIPDECEPDCDQDGQFDWLEINNNMDLDIDRTVVPDACQDCDADGVTDAEALGGAHNLWVAAGNGSLLRQYHARSGVEAMISEDGFLSGGQDVIIDELGRLMAASSLDNRVVQFDAVSGAYVGDFVTAGSSGLSSPTGMVFAPWGNLLVSSRNTDNVLEYDGETGTFVGEFVVAGAGELSRPYDMVFNAGGNLLVASGGTHEVKLYDGSSGAFISNFVTANSGGLTGPRGMVFNEGNLLVASFNTNSILEYDGLTGAFIRQFNESGQSSGYWELARPRTLRIGPNGQVYASSSQGEAGIHMYDKISGKFLRMFYVLSLDGLSSPTGFDFVPGFDVDCNLTLLPDACDIAAGASVDVNGNGVPDECESISLCEGDTNGDGAVDPLDSGYVQARFGCVVGAGDGDCDTADANADLVVDPLDVGFVLARLGSCS